MEPQTSPEIERAMGLLPSVACVMTSAFDDRRAGVLVQWVMQCSTEPVFVAIAPLKGHPIAPLIRDSHAFGLCLIDRKDRLLLKKFADHDDSEQDPFASFETTTLTTGAPLLSQAVAVLDCEVVRHFDLEADHEIYVGHVLNARELTNAPR